MQLDQVGVLPYRRGDHAIEVLLVTTRKRGRWIFPKGNIEEELGPRRSAVLEALEEAGVEGRVHSPALGTYRHGRPPEKTVELYLMEVREQHETWMEQDEASGP